MKLSYLYRGTPGHPLHPPLTDVVIGAYTFALIAAIADVTGASERSAAHGWWLALFVGLVVTIPAALTGLFDWLSITWGSELWKTATSHMVAMLAATALLGVTALVRRHGVHARDARAEPARRTCHPGCEPAAGARGREGRGRLTRRAAC
jgi:uncharacterized membrane protein